MNTRVESEMCGFFGSCHVKHANNSETEDRKGVIAAVNFQKDHRNATQREKLGPKMKTQNSKKLSCVIQRDWVLASTHLNKQTH